MIRKLFLLFLLLLSAIIAFLHIYAIKYSLYWTFQWFDILLHFLGGLWISSAIFWIYFLKKPVLTYKKILGIIIITIIIGLLWEIFEVIIDPQLPSNYFPDTILDLIMDTLGAIVTSTIIGLTKLKNGFC